LYTIGVGSAVAVDADSAEDAHPLAARRVAGGGEAVVAFLILADLAGAADAVQATDWYIVGAVGVLLAKAFANADAVLAQVAAAVLVEAFQVLGAVYAVLAVAHQAGHPALALAGGVAGDPRALAYLALAACGILAGGAAEEGARSVFGLAGGVRVAVYAGALVADAAPAVRAGGAGAAAVGVPGAALPFVAVVGGHAVCAAHPVAAGVSALALVGRLAGAAGGVGKTSLAVAALGGVRARPADALLAALARGTIIGAVGTQQAFVAPVGNNVAAIVTTGVRLLHLVTVQLDGTVGVCIARIAVRTGTRTIVPTASGKGNDEGHHYKWQELS
jgi:hypothetical protein